jgi:hypothetical protein
MKSKSMQVNAAKGSSKQEFGQPLGNLNGPLGTATHEEFEPPASIGT